MNSDGNQKHVFTMACWRWIQWSSNANYVQLADRCYWNEIELKGARKYVGAMGIWNTSVKSYTASEDGNSDIKAFPWEITWKISITWLQVAINIACIHNGLIRMDSMELQLNLCSISRLLQFK